MTPMHETLVNLLIGLSVICEALKQILIGGIFMKYCQSSRTSINYNSCKTVALEL